MLTCHQIPFNIHLQISKAASDLGIFLTFQQRAPRNHDEPGYATSRMVLVSIYLKRFEITKNPQGEGFLWNWYHRLMLLVTRCQKSIDMLQGGYR